MDLRLAAALNLSRDALAAEVCAAFEARDVRPILLKGASFAAWLYDEETPRCYSDVDLLIDPADGPVADEVLAGLGFAPSMSRSWVFDRLPYGRCWRRDGLAVDLHRAIWGIEASPGDAWAAFSEETELLTVGGLAVRTFAAPGRAMHLALHAAQHGGQEAKPLADLARALDRVSFETWEAAGDLARRVGAAQAMAVGLGLHPQGRDLAVRLELPERTSRYLLTGMSRPGAYLAHVAGMRDVRVKVVLAFDALVPTRASIRARSALARRGRLGLALAYPRESGRKMWKIATAAVAVVRAGRAPATSRPHGAGPHSG